MIAAIQRRWFFARQRAIARLDLLRPVPAGLPRMVFLVGSGRSGTTILGELLGRHPSVMYRHEPTARWFLVDPRTDVTHLHHDPPPGSPREGRLGLDASHALPRQAERFHRLIRRPRSVNPPEVVLEKTPHNAFRLPWLMTLAPAARVLHITRDGAAVVDSVQRYRAQRDALFDAWPRADRWWGVDRHKWAALATWAREADWHADVVERVSEPAARAAVEWLATLEAVDRWAVAWAGEEATRRMKTVAFEAIVARPREVLRDIADWLHLPPDERWLDGAIEQLRPPPSRAVEAPSLPAPLDSLFDERRKQAAAHAGDQAVD